MARFHRRSRRSFAATLALALGALAVCVPAGVVAQDNLFSVFIAPVDASGQPVTDLTVKDVSMAESGMPGKVVSVERFNVPVRVTVNVDNSADSAQVLAQFREGLTNLVTALPKDVEIEIYTTAPQPRIVQEHTADREQLAKAIDRFGPAAGGEPARFSEAMVEFSQRLESDAKQKRLTYAPVLVMITTTSPETSSVQLPQVEAALANIVRRGTRFYTVITATQAGSQSQRELLTDGRQALIAQQVVKSTGNGRFSSHADWREVPSVLAGWGKELADMHTKQTNQFRVVLERPAGVSGPLNPANLDLRLTRSGLNAAGLSGNGLHLPR